MDRGFWCTGVVAASSPVFNLADLFEIVADTAPDHPALVAGDVRQSYRQLDERSTRLANHLLDSGIGAGDHIGVHSLNRTEWVEAMLASYKIRAVPINVNYRYVEDELAYVFANADLAALIFEAKFTDRIHAVLPRVPSLRHCIAMADDSGNDYTALSAVEYERAVHEGSPSREFGDRSGDDLYIVYTGGTTGMPKGTVWRHEDIFFGALQGGNPFGDPIRRPDELAGLVKPVELQGTFLTPAPLMHGSGQWSVLISLFCAGKFVLYTGQRFDADEILALAAREGVHSISIIGDAMALPIADALEADPDRHDLSSLIMLGSSGAILSPPVKDRLRRALPGRFVLDSFGSSETGHDGTVMDADGPSAGPRFTLGPETTVVNDDLVAVQPGSGEIGRLARTGHIPLGYYKDEARTSKTFVEIGGRRFVMPGDYATVEADGTATLLGRGSVCITSGGEKVYPEEVEAALKAHPAVFDALVVGTPHRRFGESVTAVVCARPGLTTDLEELRATCRSRIADYKLPRRLVLVDGIERTPAGKPDYRWAKAVAGESLATDTT